MMDLGPDALAYSRGSGMACVVNMGSAGLALPGGEVLLSSAPLEGGELPPDAAAWIAGAHRARKSTY